MDILLKESLALLKKQRIATELLLKGHRESMKPPPSTVMEAELRLDAIIAAAIAVTENHETIDKWLKKNTV